MTVVTKGVKALVRAGLVCAMSSPLMASAALVVTTTNDVSQLSGALFAANSGVNLISSQLTLGAANQQGTYSGFSLAPSSGSTPTLQLQDGVVLTTGGERRGSPDQHHQQLFDDSERCRLCTAVDVVGPEYQ